MAIGGNTAYAVVASLPRLVAAAVDLANSVGFDNSCDPAQGRLLSVLAAGRNGARIGETGTGCGVGLAWMLDATDSSTSLVSIERDAGRAAASARLFAEFPNVRILHGDWTGLVHHGPFDLLVLDGGGHGKNPAAGPPIDPAAGWLAVGGMVVVDDFTPGGQLGAVEPDEARQYWLEHPLLQATEVRLSPTLATIIGVRIR
jgi:predicted O-methyltransferase YrrM